MVVVVLGQLMLALEDDGQHVAQVERVRAVASAARNGGHFLAQGGQSLLGGDLLPGQALHRVLVLALFPFECLERKRKRHY